MTAINKKNQAAALSQFSSPRTASQISDIDKEQMQNILKVMMAEKRKYDEKSKASAKKEVLNFEAKAEAMLKKHKNRVATHLAETSEAYRITQTEANAQDAAIERLKQGYLEGLSRKHQLSCTFVESVEKLCKQGDDNLEGCIGAFEEILMKSARRPGGKTDGIVGKTLEGRVSADIKLIREGDVIGEEDEDMQVEEI